MTKFENLDPEEKIREFIDQDTLYESEMDLVLNDPDAIAVSAMSEEELAEQLKDIESAVAAKIELVSEMIGERRTTSGGASELTAANSNVPSKRSSKLRAVAGFAAGMVIVCVALPFGWITLGKHSTGGDVEERELAGSRLLSSGLVGGIIPDDQFSLGNHVSRHSVILVKVPRTPTFALSTPSVRSSEGANMPVGGSEFTEPFEQRLAELTQKVDAISEQGKRINEIYAMLAVERAFSPTGIDTFVAMPQSLDFNPPLWSAQAIDDVPKKPKSLGTEVSSAAPRFVSGMKDDHTKGFDPSFVKWSGNWALGEY